MGVPYHPGMKARVVMEWHDTRLYLSVKVKAKQQTLSKHGCPRKRVFWDQVRLFAEWTLASTRNNDKLKKCLLSSSTEAPKEHSVARTNGAVCCQKVFCSSTTNARGLSTLLERLES
ncbi:hypothetical protein TNCV_1514501 [Trichonephila clavipes]|nr:hypothetical protein TNCV_1514501 [Trichonephila clavipes]